MCESDLLLLTDTQLNSNGKYCVSSIYFSLFEIYVITNFVYILDVVTRECDTTDDSFYSPETSSGNTSSLPTDIFSEDSDMELPDISSTRQAQKKHHSRKKSKCLRTVRSTSSRKKEVEWKT